MRGKNRELYGGSPQDAEVPFRITESWQGSMEVRSTEYKVVVIDRHILQGRIESLCSFLCPA